MLREVLITGRDDAATEVIIEPYAQAFNIPPRGCLEISIQATEKRVEINLNEDGGITVWLFEAGDITMWDRATLDARHAAKRRRSWAEPKAIDEVVKELRYYARRIGAEKHPLEEREAVAARVKWLELTRDILKRGERLPHYLKAELLAWALSEERLPMREVFVGILRAAVELGSAPSSTPSLDVGNPALHQGDEG